MEIKIIGDFLPEGKFAKHSEFRNVVNYVNEENQILSFADDIKYLNPNTIIVSKINLNIDNFTFKNNILSLENQKFDISSSKRYISTLNENISINFENISNFIEEYHRKFNKKSLIFLLKEEHTANFESSFDKAYVKYMQQAFAEIKKGKIIEGVSKMKSAGFGLTPSGDDFIAGILYALHLKNVDENFISEIKNTALSKNLISNSLINFASKNAYYLRLKTFVETLFLDYQNIEKVFKELLEIGETSSSDLLTGFFSELSE